MKEAVQKGKGDSKESKVERKKEVKEARKKVKEARKALKGGRKEGMAYRYNGCESSVPSIIFERAGMFLYNIYI